MLNGLLIRKARLADVPALAELIDGYARRGVMLPRTEFELAEGIRDFTVALDGDRFAGCGALHIYTADSGEVRSLAVDASRERRGVGRAIVEALETEAREFGLRSLFAFTYVTGFFAKLGYRELDRAELPLKAWKDCLRCPKFKACDEIAVRKWIADSPEIASITRASGDSGYVSLPRTSPLPVLPTAIAIAPIPQKN
jgi:amino-acid N-acetyltransferase